MNNMMRLLATGGITTFLLFNLLVPRLNSQTKIKAAAISSQGSTGRVLVINGRGDVVFATIDATLELDSTNPALPVLRVAGSRDEQVDVQVLSASSGTFTLSRAPGDVRTLRFHRNGVLLSPGVDFSVIGAVVTMVPQQTLQVDDVINVSYR